MKNLKRAALIGGAYLCLAGNGMAFDITMFSHSMLFNQKTVKFNVQQDGKDLKCNGEAVVGSPNDKGYCMVNLTEETELKINVTSSGGVIICDKSFTYKPNKDIFVTLYSNKDLCSIGTVK